ncbi:MAG: signal recognition particle protein [Planctomycetales bacterium]|nr:signal recognition particle protein [Planctomycetales bacterium]NIM09584.1 signal recognition particle protein [Planctomycetales bacterium]NIN09074.1 signal recognition particle protein [Planctomycetales bacterium]NIN78186.1 signal recognition particle protein [Planctomycetales bacterium]NIO35373.1 signal recognition particle protein [Planctomycetales bacterium]
MFDALQENLSTAFRSLSGKGKLSEANMRDGLSQVRAALLEADVSLPVVKDFMQRVSEQALGERVLKSLDPSQQVVGIVHEELIHLMGPVDHSLHLRTGLTVLMLCGLQGSGKTTTCAKLAMLVKQLHKRPMLCAADLQRPAAIDQLHVLGQQIDVPVYSDRENKNAVQVCQDAVAQAKQQEVDVLILDTAGRLAIDQQLMDELSEVDRRVQPDQVYLVVDAMTGQDAVNSARGFNEALELDGCIMTKLDGDARGGAALSVKHVTGVPVKFIGTGEQIEALEEFHPDRMAGRILGMGDVLTLVEQAQRKLDQEELARQEERLRKGEFTLDDFRKQLSQVTRLGPMQKVMGMMGLDGGMSELVDGMDVEKDMKRLFGIIDAMTPDERRNPTKVIDQSRRRRIADGAGVAPHEVNDLVKQFDGMASMMKQMAGKGMRDRMRMARELQKQAMSDPSGTIAKQKVGTGKRLSPKERQKLKKQREKEARRRKREIRAEKKT